MPVFHQLFLEWVDVPSNQSINDTAHAAGLDFGDWLLSKGSNVTETLAGIIQPLLLTHVTTLLWQHYAIDLIEQHRRGGESWRRLAPFRRVLPSRWFGRWGEEEGGKELGRRGGGRSVGMWMRS